MPSTFTKTKNTAVSAVMCVCFVIAVAVVMMYYSTWKNAVQVFNIASEFFCMIVILVVYLWYLRRKKSSDKSIAIFSDMCLVIYFAEFFDIIAWSVDGIKAFEILNMISTVIVFLLSFVYGIMFIRYMFSYVDEYASVKRIKKTVYILIAVLCVIGAILAATGKLFYIDDKGAYHTSDLFIVAFITMPVINIYVCGVVSGFGLSPRRIIAFLSYPILMGFEAAIVALNISIDNSLMVNTFSLIFIYCVNFMDTEINRNSLDKNIRIYLSEEVASQLNGSENALEPGGSTVTVSMLFCMLHSFGNELDTMQPEDAVKVLNHFFGEMTDIIAENKGVLLEFPGYGLFCIFGAFNDCTDHASAAVRTGCRMQERMEEINKWETENGYPELNIGVGINTGEVVLGNIGSRNHMRYTAISQHVNLASRLESYSSDGDVIVAQNTLEYCSIVSMAEKIMTIIPKGIAEPINVYRVLRTSENK